MKRAGLLVVLVYLAFATAHFLSPAPSAIDLGRWHLVVIESDDWGMEAWVPDLRAARAIANQSAHLSPWLQRYAESSLETAADVESLTAILRAHRDSDGLPAVIQANHIMAAIDLDSCGTNDFHLQGSSVLLRQPGSCGAYARPGLNQAVDEARAQGVWRAELHGLTHFDLGAYEHAVAQASTLTVRARAYGVVAFPHWLTLTELGSGNRKQARAFAGLSCELFRQRFGRAPASVIAPDYTWGAQDERAWARQGLQVVQAKREQIDPGLNRSGLGSKIARRVIKVISRWRDRCANRFVYLDRNVHLEPYGDPDPKCFAGASQAADQVARAWGRGEPAIVEAHRLQFSHLNPLVSWAGRLQLRRLLTELESTGEVRYCVDVEVAQLRRRGWSVLQRGPWTIIRNYTGRPLLLDIPLARSQPLAPGTHLYLRRLSEGISATQSYR
jgi:hypothetical protein